MVMMVEPNLPVEILEKEHNGKVLVKVLHPDCLEMEIVIPVDILV